MQSPHYVRSYLLDLVVFFLHRLFVPCHVGSLLLLFLLHVSFCRPLDFVFEFEYIPLYISLGHQLSSVIAIFIVRALDPSFYSPTDFYVRVDLLDVIDAIVLSSSC